MSESDTDPSESDGPPSDGRSAVRRLGAQLQDGDAGLIALVMAGIYVLFTIFAILGPSQGFEGVVAAIQTVTLWTALYAMLVLALNLHWGYAGLFNIGVAGFMAVGVYTFAALTAPTGATPPGLGLPLWVGIVGGMLMAALAGALVSLPALRLRADYLAIVTVAFSEIVRLSLLSTTFEEFTLFSSVPFLPDVPLGTGAGRGISMPINPTIPVKSIYYTNPQNPAAGDFTAFGETVITAFRAVGVRQTVVVSLTYTLVLLGFVALFYWLLRRIGNSPFGRVLKAIREDELVANSLGKDTRMFKIKVFMVGCALMGLGGILWETQRGFTDPTSTTFRPIQTFYIFIALIIGGAGSNTGGVLGGALFAALLFQGPLYVSRILSKFIATGDAPSTFAGALAPVASLNLTPFVAYTLQNVSSLRFVLVGVVLIVLMHRRPTGLLGHRKEVASSIDLGKRTSRTGPGEGRPATDGGNDVGGERDD
ncbi:branched-chain amino acid ABC transporter permease [Halosimplex salinum]|uniref:branched-chain amino acid ABC transporter permease n=1 Tax=Halosimplex salinum TaxID=1710538 RepID=UPI000F47C1B9|nr:branched-chain amino acid ABC transporter permease [Halosimplex salinum]